MKLFLDYKLNDSGKGKMLQRLIPALKRLGVKTKFKEKGCDVALGISRWRSDIKIPKVIRIDGIHLTKSKKNDWKNERIRKGIKKADAVIFQSEFAKKKVKKYFKLKDKKEFVIFNGADPDDYNLTNLVLRGAEFVPLKNRKDSHYNIIASAKWCHRNGYRKHKRLDTVIKVASCMPDIHFYVAGRLIDKYKETDNLTFLGQLEEEKLRRVLRMSHIMLYPAEYDWCPNAVVEAICAGCPVVCTEGHGVTELMRACGGKAANTVDEMIYAINDLLANPIVVNTDPVHIDTIAKQYKKALESVL